MVTYPTIQTNIRTPKLLVLRVKERTTNYNGFAREALTEFCRRLQLKGTTDDYLQYITYNGKRPRELDVFYREGTQLVTYRLKEIDVQYLKLSQYSTSRALHLAILYKLVMS